MSISTAPVQEIYPGTLNIQCTQPTVASVSALTWEQACLLHLTQILRHTGSKAPESGVTASIFVL